MKIIEDINNKNQTDTLLKGIIIQAEGLVDSLKALKKSTQLNVLGWSVYESGNFFKSSKRINGKICSIHLGKVFCRKEATEKIKAWELANLPTDQLVEEPVNLVADHQMDEPMADLEPSGSVADQLVEEPLNLVADHPVDVRECRMLIDLPSCPDEMPE